MKHLIGITGRRCSGKDTAALALVNEGYQLVKFAGPLKAMLRTYFAYCGMHEADIEAAIEGDQKEASQTVLGGKSTRLAMQRLGSEWGRDMIHKNIWVDACRERCLQFEKVVVSDLRFPNEMVALKELGGYIIRITRPGMITDTHISETLIDNLDVDFEIRNNRTIEELQTKVKFLALKTRSSAPYWDFK